MNENLKKAPHYLDDPQLGIKTKEFLKILNASDTPVESLPPVEARKVLEGAQSSVEVDLSGIEEVEKKISVDGQDITLYIVRPQGVKEKLPVFMFIHGGGWVLGDYPTHKRLVRDLVVESGYASVFVDYSRSPEAKYPKAINEIYAATQWVVAHADEINVDSQRLAIVGNSVGGNMTIATALRAKEEVGPKLKCMILLWPLTDAALDWDSYKLYGEERFLTTSLMKWMFDQYTTDPDQRKEIYHSPLQASLNELKGLPPTLITVAENDVLLDQGEAFGRKLDAAGVDVTTIRFNGVIHDWGMLNGFADLSETHTLVTLCSATLRKYL